MCVLEEQPLLPVAVRRLLQWSTSPAGERQPRGINTQSTQTVLVRVVTRAPRSLMTLIIEFFSNYSAPCGTVLLQEASAGRARLLVPRARLFVQPVLIGSGGTSSLVVKPAQVALFTDNHKGSALTLATAGIAASFSFMTRDEFFNMRTDQAVRPDCAADADCTLAARVTPVNPQASNSNRALGGAITLHSSNNYFNVAYTVTAAGVYALSVSAVYRLASGNVCSVTLLMWCLWKRNACVIVTQNTF
jgi:hypothetical protein